MLADVIVKRVNCWKAVLLPHCIGRVPDMLPPSVNCVSFGKDPELPQTSGKVPVDTAHLSEVASSRDSFAMIHALETEMHNRRFVTWTECRDCSEDQLAGLTSWDWCAFDAVLCISGSVLGKLNDARIVNDSLLKARLRICSCSGRPEVGTVPVKLLLARRRVCSCSGQPEVGRVPDKLLSSSQIVCNDDGQVASKCPVS